MDARESAGDEAGKERVSGVLDIAGRNVDYEDLAAPITCDGIGCE